MPRKTVIKAPLCVIVLVAAMLSAAAAHAQDTHYWTSQYGTRAQLLGGAVVGSFLDLSATFYNPGAIALMDNPEVLLSANAFELIDIKLEDESVTVEPLSYTRFGPAPSLFTGLFPSGWLPGQLAYSALTRQEFKVRMNEQAVGTVKIEEYPDSISYTAETYFDQDLGENWFGATWSKEIKPNVGFGGTMYVAYRGQRVRRQSTTEGATDNGAGFSINFTDQFNYSHFRLVGKFGLAWKGDPLTLGVAVTTPSVGLFGWGGAQFNRSVVGLDIDGDGQEDSQVYADVQDDLAPSYHSPFSIAVGGSYTRGATSIHASAEWFDGVDRYQILDAANLPAEFPGASIAQRVTQELDPVINWGIGIQHVFSRAWTGYLSFLTDYSAAPEDSPAMNSVSTWDLYHISTGGAFRVKGLDLTAGFQYARGKEDIQVGFVPGQGWDNEIPIGLQKNTDVTYQRLLFIIGFAFSI